MVIFPSKNYFFIRSKTSESTYKIVYICRQAGLYVSMYACVYACMEINMQVTPLSHHYPLRGQQAHIKVNICVFVNTIQKMDME